MRDVPPGFAGWLTRRLPPAIADRCFLPVYHEAVADYVAGCQAGWRVLRPLRTAAFHVRLAVAAVQCAVLASRDTRRPVSHSQHEKRSAVDPMFLQDVRFAIRMLRKNPSFTAVAGIALALGIGANTAIFSVIHAVLLRPLPYADASRIVQISESMRAGLVTVSPPNYLDWKARNRTLDGIAAYQDGEMTLGGGEAPQRLASGFVGADLFTVLGVTPMLGPGFLPEDERPGAPPTVVLGYGLWQSRFGGDQNIIGRSLRFEGSDCQVVGVMPRGFTFPGEIDLWFPLILSERDTNPGQRGAHYLEVVGRLKPGVTVEQAYEDLAAIERDIAAQFSSVQGYGIWIQPLLESIVGDVRRPLLTLLGAVGFVLLIACANVSNLLLARANGRRSEIAIRTALGAGRWRIVRQLLAESLVLSLAGGVAGVLVAAWTVRALASALPQDLPRSVAVDVNAPVLLFSTAISLLTGILFGIAPAVYASTPDVSTSLRDARRDGFNAGGRGRLRSALVVVEVALALMLLAGAGLALRSFDRLNSVDPGFDPANVLSLTAALPEARYPDTAAVSRFYRSYLDILNAQPGVIAAGAVMRPPLSMSGFGGTFTIVGQADVADQRMQVRPATPGYFEALRIPLRRGRFITSADHISAQHVAVISDEAARRFWPGVDPIGKRIRIHVSIGVREREREIVGVVGDVKIRTMQAAPAPVVYVPHAQYVADEMTIFARTAGDPWSLLPGVKSTLAQLDREVALTNVRPAERLVAASVAQPRFRTFMLSLFALMALVLAAVGLYGVMAYSVSQRRSELGLRLALGAGRGDVLRLVLRQGLQPVAIGIVAGLGGAMLVTRIMSTLIFEISAFDPLTFVFVPLLLAIIAAAACYVPARRATRVDPLTALRSD